MRINEANLCFVNSHLSAGAKEVDRRREDFNEIERRMIFEYNSNSESGLSRLSINDHEYGYIFIFSFFAYPIFNLISYHFSHIFWFGDLNYRLYDNPPRSFFDTKDFTQILQQDQLKREMLYKRVFVDYNEGPINFQPTYKYDPGTDNWESR